MTPSTECCVPGCGGGTAPDVPPQSSEGLCEAHVLLASVESRRLLQSAARRLTRLQRSWDDDRVFEEIAVRGRYLAFCALLETAHDHVDRAWERVRSEVLGAAGDLHPCSPGIAPIADVPDHRFGAASWALDSRRRIAPAPQE
jgi:hypothetical protein